MPLPRHRRALTTVAYEGAAAELIRRLKFEGRRDGLPVLVRLLNARVSGLRFDGIVPVPRHWRRIRDEGCDPAFDLARGLSRTTGRPLWWRSLARARWARPQVELALADRRRNLVGAFRAREPGARGRVVLLVDDVSTSGTTLQEAARELRRGGARRVLRLAVAGTRNLPRPRPLRYNPPAGERGPPVADTVRIKQACTLGHQPNLGDEVERVEFEEGEELSVLQEWDNAYLLKNNDGKLFNVSKNLVDPA